MSENQMAFELDRAKQDRDKAELERDVWHKECLAANAKAVEVMKERDALRALLLQVKAWRDSDGNEGFPHDLRQEIESALR